MSDAGHAPLAPLLRTISDEGALSAASSGLEKVVAVPDAARALFIAALAERSTKRPIVVAVPTNGEAERLVHDLGQFLGTDAVERFPAWETLPFERVSPAIETMGRRLRVLWRIREGGEHAPRVVVAPVRALVQRLGPHVEAVEPVVVHPGDQIDRDGLIEALVAAGYRREYQVEARGEVAVRGSIVDVFPSTSDHPIRIDLWGDEVDRLSQFSVADQRSTHDVESLAIFPARELLPTDDVRARAEALITEEPWGRDQWQKLADGHTFDGMESWLPWLTESERLVTDLLPADALVVLVEPRRMRDRAKELLDDESELATALATTWDAGDARLSRLSLPFDQLLATTRAAAVNLVATPESPDTPFLAATSFDPVAGDTTALANRIRALVRDGITVVLAADGRGSAQRIADVLAGEGIVVAVRDELDAAALAAPGVHVVAAALERGAVLPGLGVALIAESDLTGRRRTHKAAPRGQRRGADFYDSLQPGDFVVHHLHGVGKYEGMVTRAIGGVERDYLMLAYKSGDKLYVPTDQVGTVRRYTGGEAPPLHRLGGADFAKAKGKVRHAVAEIAMELVELYRTRISTVGHAFGPDTPWQREMEDAFEYEETPDQQKAIDETKADMEKAIPMDRLVCGDVGFGKTEVAVRAAFKAVQDGTQVAILVPTTLLATQHGQTFRDRFANYPVRVEVMSRFLTTKEQNAVVAGVKDGTVDVVIGTHRLLSDDVQFKNLGLLIVDEEQRFGVTHKERMKAMRANVDVLTLSATPIPRTLEMSLTGIRDLSLITTPPVDRQPILTYVGEYEERAVAEAIRRELLREGQVFFVHNRVQDIEHVAEKIKHVVPEARVCIAHGQMDENSLERVVMDFYEGQFDVMVCTTIVESGLDIASANTLVVDRADRLGLAQLYQLRGRVGRRGRRAYAYLLHPADTALTEEAYERLKTIGEFTDLGSGFKIAMRDLEIRGAGNILGAQQSGHIAAVGFDLYCQMVTEAVGELMGNPVVTPVDITVDLPVDANLPREYVARDDVRMEAYRRLAAVTDEQDVADIESEWSDRYGPLPAPAQALLDVARVRAEAVRLGISSVTVQKGMARIVGIDLLESQKVRLRRLAPKSVAKPDEIALPVPPGAGAGPAIVDLLRELVPVTASTAAVPVSSPAL